MSVAERLLGDTTLRSIADSTAAESPAMMAWISSSLKRHTVSPLLLGEDTAEVVDTATKSGPGVGEAGGAGACRLRRASVDIGDSVTDGVNK